MSLDILNLCVGIIFSFIDIYLMKCYIPHSINTKILTGKNIWEAIVGERLLVKILILINNII